MYLILRIGPFVAAEWNYGCVIIISTMIFFWSLYYSWNLQWCVMEVLVYVNRFAFIVLNHNCMLQWCTSVAALCSRHCLSDLQ